MKIRLVPIRNRAHAEYHIGKESNLIEEQEERVLTTDPQALYLAEGNLEEIRSQLENVSVPKLAARSRVSERMLQSIRQGKRRPSVKTIGAIMGGLARMLDEAEG
jgi:DNA-binding transcriptional regulator YiaG